MAVAENQPDQNRMDLPFSDISNRIRAFIENATGDFDALAAGLFALQYEHVPVYRSFCQSRDKTPGDSKLYPALPTTAFRDFEVTSLPANERLRVFHSSGTTANQPSRHWHNSSSLAIYECSLTTHFKQHLDPARQRTLSLTPDPSEASESSLAHMMQIVQPKPAFAGRIGPGGWELNYATATQSCAEAIEAAEPILIMGPAFSFVHWLDELGGPIQLPTGSRIMETGGYKGRSRELSREALHEYITIQLGVPRSAITREYGMCELGSQAYASGSADRFTFPHWARPCVISPETMQEVGEGETGLLQVMDLANVYSVFAIQTADLAVRRGSGFEIMGRAKGAEARGCSLALTGN